MARKRRRRTIPRGPIPAWLYRPQQGVWISFSLLWEATDFRPNNDVVCFLSFQKDHLSSLWKVH